MGPAAYGITPAMRFAGFTRAGGEIGEEVLHCGFLSDLGRKKKKRVGIWVCWSSVFGLAGAGAAVRAAPRKPSVDSMCLGTASELPPAKQCAGSLPHRHKADSGLRICSCAAAWLMRVSISSGFQNSARTGYWDWALATVV